MTLIIEILAAVTVTIFGGVVYIFYKKNGLLKMQNDTLAQQVDILRERMQGQLIENTKITAELANCKSTLAEKNRQLKPKAASV